MAWIICSRKWKRVQAKPSLLFHSHGQLKVTVVQEAPHLVHDKINSNKPTLILDRPRHHNHTDGSQFKYSLISTSTCGLLDSRLQ